MPRPSVIMIREADAQLSGSGCCGRLEGELLGCELGKATFVERRAAMERMGPLYQGLRSRYGDAVELQVLDPRNVSLLFLLVRDMWRHRVGLGRALRTLARVPVQAVVVNGRLIAGGAWPSVDEVAAVLDRGAPAPARSVVSACDD